MKTGSWLLGVTQAVDGTKLRVDCLTDTVGFAAEVLLGWNVWVGQLLERNGGWTKSQGRWHLL
jgi:hypothetical protein